MVGESLHQPCGACITILACDMQCPLLDMISNSEQPSILGKRNGRHEETRTPDLYRVKVALCRIFSDLRKLLANVSAIRVKDLRITQQSYAPPTPPQAPRRPHRTPRRQSLLISKLRLNAAENTEDLPYKRSQAKGHIVLLPARRRPDSSQRSATIRANTKGAAGRQYRRW